MDVLLVNFSPGSGSNRDGAPEGHKSFVPSRKIVDDAMDIHGGKAVIDGPQNYLGNL